MALLSLSTKRLKQTRSTHSVEMVGSVTLNKGRGTRSNKVLHGVRPFREPNLRLNNNVCFKKMRNAGIGEEKERNSMFRYLMIRVIKWSKMEQSYHTIVQMFYDGMR